MAYDPNDTELVLFLARAGGCSLASSPGDKDNWIERAGPGGKGGRLPNYICKIAKGVMRSGKSKSQAIAIAVDRVKAWAAGGDDVEADTRAKAAKALAQWEALKAKSKAKRVVKATHAADGSPYLFLAQEGMQAFDTDLVRRAWDTKMADARARWRAAHVNETTYEGVGDVAVPDYPRAMWSWVKSLWTTFIIVEFDDPEHTMMKIPYTVTGEDVTFGAPEKVRISYESDPEWEDEWDGALFDDDDEEDWEFSPNELLLLGFGG